jgi:tetratricopeptide (TPR) repeat protein
LLLILLSTAIAAFAEPADSPAPETENAAIRNFEIEIEHGNYTTVCSQLESYAQAHPDSWRALYQLGYVYLQLHEVRKSLAMLSKSLVLNDRFADAHKTLAFDLNILGRQDLATVELKRAIQLDPNSFESHYELGRILFEQAYYRDAIEQFTKTRALAPEFVKVYHNLGLAYAAVGENANAVAEFQKALDLNSKSSKPSAWPLIDFGTYYNLQGDFEKAKEMLLQAIQIDRTWDQAYSELAKAYRGLGETTKAIDNLKRAIAINPKKPEYHYSLAILYRKTSQTAEATQQLKEYEDSKATTAPK